MEPETTVLPELRPDDLVQFVESHRPRLEAGDYTVSVKQTLQIDAASDSMPLSFDSGDLAFSVLGDRLSLGDENFHAVFPPPGSRGKFGHVLPHVALNRSTLPWERSPLGGTVEDPESPSWLALLVFTKDESPQISAQIVTADQLQSNPDSSPATAKAATYFQKDFTLESGQHPSDRVSVIDVTWGLLKTLLPRYHDLGVTAHVRRVGRPTGHSGADGGMHVISAAPPARDKNGSAPEATNVVGQPVNAWDPISPELALIIANRLPTGGKNCVVHLVSLEERYEYPDKLTGTPDPCLLGLHLDVGNETLAGWLRSLSSQATLTLIAGMPPKVDVTDTKGISTQTSADNTVLDAASVKEMCESMLGGELSVWRSQLNETGKVRFSAPFSQNGVSLGRIEVTIFEEGQDFEPLTEVQIQDLGNHALPVKSFTASGVKLIFLDSTANPLTDDKTNRLANWIEFQARARLLAERTSLLKSVPQSAASDFSKMTLADLLKSRQSEVLEHASSNGAEVDQVQPEMPQRLKGWLGDQPGFELDTRALTLGVTLVLDRQSSEVTATLSRRVRLRAGKFRILNPEPIFDAHGAKDEDKVRLVSLKSWKFECLEEGGGFTEELTSLNRSNPAVAEFHVPLPGGLSENTSSEHEVALAEGRRYLGAGAVALRHGLRGGDRTFSWYHGPFLSNARAQAKLRLPARGPDELLIYNETVGMFDVSYAAAWELGRLTMLEDSSFAMTLFHWKRDHSRTLAHLRQKLDHDFLPLVRQTPDLAPPDSLAAWFRSLTMLEDIPFNYLVPDEQLLPTESIRFFTVDSMWLECLRDGAFSVGRVLEKDHLEDAGHSRNMDDAPRLSGFLLRSKVVSDWPQLVVNGYTGVDRSDAELETEPNPPYPKLTLERFDRLGPNVLICLFSDPDRAGRELEMADIHLPAEVLHFGLEDEKHGDPHEPPKLIKQLRDPRSGEDLCQWSWSGQVDPAGDVAGGYQIDRVTLETLEIAGVDPAILNRIRAIENFTFKGTAANFINDHVKGNNASHCAGLTQDELDARLHENSDETLEDLIVRISGPFQDKNQTIEDIPFRSNAAPNVIDLTGLFDEVANRLNPILPQFHRFTAADFSLQMLDLPPLVRFVRPVKPEVK